MTGLVTDERDAVTAMLLGELLDDGVVRDRRAQARPCSRSAARCETPRDDSRRSDACAPAGSSGSRRTRRRARRAPSLPSAASARLRSVSGRLRVVGKVLSALGRHTVPDQVELEPPWSMQLLRAAWADSRAPRCGDVRLTARTASSAPGRSAAGRPSTADASSAAMLDEAGVQPATLAIERIGVQRSDRSRCEPTPGDVSVSRTCFSSICRSCRSPSRS